jgi:fructokinase
MLAAGPVGESLGNTRPVVHDRLDRLVDLADIVKVSAEDLAWLEGPAELEAAAERWAGRGPALVLVTDGGGRSGSPARAGRWCGAIHRR